MFFIGVFFHMLFVRFDAGKTWTQTYSNDRNLIEQIQNAHHHHHHPAQVDFFHFVTRKLAPPNHYPHHTPAPTHPFFMKTEHRIVSVLTTTITESTPYTVRQRNQIRTFRKKILLFYSTF